MALRSGQEVAWDGGDVIVVAEGLEEPLIDYGRLPEDASVFRCGSFTGEDSYWFGRHVAAWFADGLLPPEISAGLSDLAYDIDRVVVNGVDRAQAQTPLRFIDREITDWTQPLVGHPELLRELLRVVSPSLPLIAAAYALSTGAKQVRVIREGLSPLHRRPYVKPIKLGGTARVRVRDAGHQPMLSDQSSIDAAFLDALVATFGSSRITDASSSHTLKGFLDRSEVASKPLAPREKSRRDTAGGEPFHELSFADGTTRRCAYVTVCDNESYLWGVRAMARSLRKVSDVPLIMLVPDSLAVSDIWIEAPGVHLLRTSSISNPNIDERHQQRFVNTYTKLSIFGLDFLDTAVFIDADTVVLHPIDDLFERRGFAAAPDFGLRFESDAFNSGVFVCQPDRETFENMLAAIPEMDSYDGGDQGFLNSFITDVEWLPREYNLLRRVPDRYPEAARLDAARVIHYVGKKPWELGAGVLSPLDRLWLNQLSNTEMVEFVGWLRSCAARGAGMTSDDIDSEYIERKTALLKASGKRSFEVAQHLLAEGHVQAAMEMAQGAVESNPDSVANRKVIVSAKLRQGNLLGAAKESQRIAVLRARRAPQLAPLRKLAKKTPLVRLVKGNKK